MGISVVLAAVAIRAAVIHFAPGEQPDARAVIEAPRIGYSIVDREGRPLALSVECFDVTISPRAMWRSHTPDYMSRRIAEVLDDPAGAVADRKGADLGRRVNEVLVRSMPHDLEDGVLPGRLTPRRPILLRFGQDRVEAVRSWIETGAIGDREPTARIAGVSLVPVMDADPLPGESGSPATDEGPAWTIGIDPKVALSKDTRREQLPVRFTKGGEERVASAERWTRRLLRDLVALAGGESLVGRLPDELAAEVARMSQADRSQALRDAVWAELFPTRFRVLARGIDPERAHALRDLFAEEAVSPYQVQLVARTERRHPTRPGGLPAAPDPEAELERPDDAFWLLGHWGVLDEGRAHARALADRESRPHVLPWDDADDPFEAYERSLIVESRPWSGIELLARTELENGPWATLAEPGPGRTYVRRTRAVARDRRGAWENGVPDYFEGALDAEDPAILGSTLDAGLQEILHAELGLLMDRHRPALSMGIVVEVDSGDVLALDARTAYPYSGFAPVRHVFTPGSTFKAVIMALALDAGVTTPETEYPTYAGSAFFVDGRHVGEALGAPEEARITAAEALAFSCNAVLVQIALGMEAPYLRDRLVALGYGAKPGAGLGPEQPGTLPPLVRGTWSRPYTHTSIGFGHEIGVTLWQHATSLATVMRGGVFRPLRLLRSFERGEERWDRPVDEGQRVLSEHACAQVRAMMAIGAQIGTGRHVGTRELNPEFAWLGTKTGTTEKVASELCVHLELEAMAAFAAEKKPFTAADRVALGSRPRPHRRSSCYTSSMCASGRIVVDGVAREVMVLIVADDPAGPERFGSKVTGKTTLAILRQAMGLERSPGGASVAEVSGQDAARNTGSADRPAAAARDGRGPRLYEADGLLQRRGDRPSERTGFDASWLDRDLPWATVRADSAVDPDLSNAEPVGESR